MGGHSGPDADRTRQRAAQRLEILDAIVWAIEHGHQLLDITMAAANPEQAMRQVMRVAGLSEIAAAAVLEAQIRRWTAEQAGCVRAEQQEMRARLAEPDG